MIIIQVLLGGITRLTGSGLSITEWKPIMGALPPMHQKDWNIAFEKYKQIAQYKYLFFGLALMVLMIFRPQGLIPVRQKLLAYGRELFVAARKRSQREQAGGES